jgi:hypothetical protein
MSFKNSKVIVVAALLVLAGCGGKKSTGGQIDGFVDVPSDGVDTSGDASTDVITESMCIDEDGDGHGAGCEAGGDCDDTDPAHYSDCTDCPVTHAEGCACTSAETYDCYSGPDGTLDVGQCSGGTRYCEFGFLGTCIGQVLPDEHERCGDDVDNDCNGLGDEEVESSCGDCDTTCNSEGDVVPSPDDEYSDGIMENPDGPGVVLGTSEVNAGYAWIANSDEGTVSKLRLLDGMEVARYRVGLWGTSHDQPSRTAVDSLGNAYVANRAHIDATNNQPSVTKMAGDERYCDDRNGNFTIETSTGPTALPLGEDECVLWTVPVGNPGGVARALAIDLGEYEFLDPGSPWVGMWSEMRFFKLDPADGSVLEEVAVDVNPYGAAIDSDGWIWISGMRPVPGYIQRFHTVALTVDPAISTSGTGCDSPSDLIYSPYGIAVDPSNRVWIGTWSPNVCCYDPSIGAWMPAVNLGLSLARGVAADHDGTIWASTYTEGVTNRIVGIDGSSLAPFVSYDIGGARPIGVGVDELGQVWTVNQTSGSATRLNKATGTLTEFAVGTGPYTYSDFTGYQRSLMMPQGTWEHTFLRCDDDEGDHWGTLEWDADVPPGAQLTFYGFSGDAPADLTTATPVLLAEVPSDVPPVAIEAIYSASGEYLGPYLRVLVVLEPSTDLMSPVFRSLDVHWHCSSLG